MTTVTKSEKAHFDLMVTAALQGKLGLMPSKDAVTGEHRAVIVVFNEDDYEGDHGGANVLPIGHISADPMTEYAAPEGAHEIRSKDIADLIEGKLGIKLGE